MTRTVLLTAVLAALLTNIAITATNRFITGQAQARSATLRVEISTKGGPVDVERAIRNTDKLLDLTQDIDKLSKQSTLLLTNNAPLQAAATQHQLQTLDQILAELRRRPAR